MTQTDRVPAPAPKGFDPLAASKVDLARHGLPQRPDQPGPAALWEKRARRYRGFEHLRPGLLPAGPPAKVVAAAGFGLPAPVSAGFELTFATAMVDLDGATLARPEKLTDFTFRVIPG